MAILKKPDLGSEDPDNNDDCSDDLAIFQNQNEKSQRPLDFENNGLIWFPPLPDDENDEAESNFFSYDDDDDDIGDLGTMFSSSSSLVSVFPAEEKQNEGNKEPLRAAVHGHFRALVSQVLQVEGIKVGKENDVEDWLNIVTTLAWQAANFVEPDTSRGGSMNPVDYVKVKCAASGSPSESTLIKGVVCTKNIKHKRMTSQYKNPRLLLLGGALEYQKVPNELASFDSLLGQEKDHLKMIISRIETLRPNVLLVEKSVSSYAQEQLLAGEISLVLNVKRPLLERIAQCTGAIITASTDKMSMAWLGHCELFRLERVSEEHKTANQFNKKPSKTLMFFEGCPRRLGCTVLLKGACRHELKKVKHVVQHAVFAAYHLSLETSFLADGGATLPKMTLKHSIARHVAVDENEVSSEYFSATETHQSILVSFSSHCVLKGIVCERSRLLYIKFYGCFDKPLGRYLREDLFDQTCCCRSCKEPVEAHVQCYTHRRGNLTINVRCLPDKILPGERDGKIWMWHRCLRCAHVDGVPPATRMVVMSDAAWGLSFGKFLELSFSNHATANRVAPCGHSLQRDCLHYYGFGSMVAFFRYSPIDILSVHLPPSVLEFNGHVQHEWTIKEAAELVRKMETLYAEISDVLDSLEEKCKSFGNECSDTNDLQGHTMKLKDLLKMERNDYNGLLQPAIMETSQPDWLAGDILELNRLRRSLLDGSHVWDQRLCSLDSLLKKSSISKAAQGDASYAKLKELKSELSHKDGMLGHSDLVIAVYENEPTSIISYALSSKEYNDWVVDNLNEHEGSWSPHESSKEDSAVSTSSMGTFFKVPKRLPHFTISFEDEFSTTGGKVKFSVTCYFAKQFDSLRKICCPSEVDFVRSLSRCQTWSAQGGKSNVYFAKSLDERFIIKQVTKTELDSFVDFASQYFKYLSESLSSRSQTCLAKILGIYQVSVKHLKGGKETKMDLMVTENLFFKRNISRVYDLKGSKRARYNSDTTGTNKVLLDSNLLETLRTKPIFLGRKAKGSLEKAVWNDTSFLASVDVMDYSLLVGVDDERKELVLGIIDFIRQYTWDKRLETWVKKASGILGGPKNASPTIISPKQYKKRFRKAMTTYFLTVPEKWSS